MENIAVYTSITGGKDNPRDDIRVFGWYDKFKAPVMNAKFYKVLSHKIIDEDISIWVDGNIFLNVPPEKLVEEFLGNADMAVHRHPDRDDVYEECDAILKWKGDEDGSVRGYRSYLEFIDYPRHDGLYNCCVLIRRNTPLVMSFNEAWWAEICRYSTRDQLSFPVILKQFPDLRLNIIEGTPMSHPKKKHHPYYTYVEHKI